MRDSEAMRARLRTQPGFLWPIQHAIHLGDEVLKMGARDHCFSDRRTLRLGPGGTDPGND